MLENFQLTTIVRHGRTTRLLRIPLHQMLQDTLAENWQEQYAAFLDEVQEIDFDPGYTPEPHERFRLQDYELPEWLAEEDSQSVVNLDAITNDDAMLDNTSGVVAFARNEQGEEVMLFQNFSRSHIIRPGRFLFLQGDTYESARRPGLNLDRTYLKIV